jgi:hypothetical protein
MPPKRLDALLAIGKLIAPKAKLAELVPTPEDPEHDPGADGKGLDGRRRPSGRGSNPPGDELPWGALVQGLARAGAAVELDDDADAEAVRRSLEQLGGCPRGAFAWMKHDGELGDRSTEEVLELAGKALLGKSAQLVQLDSGPRQRWLTVVPEAHAAELAKLTKAAGSRSVELITGARLTKATRDRASASKRAARQATREPDRPARTLRYFARGKETWTMSEATSEAEAGFETCYEKPRVKYYVHHHFDDAVAARAGKKRQLAEWAAAGFREIDQAQFDALPHASTPYINWTAPFPDDASYVVEGKEIVRCTELRGDAIVQAAGTIGYNFGERQNVYHCKTAALAAKRYAQHVAADAHFPAISRAEVVKRYR